MRTLSAETCVKWIDDLIKIEAALASAAEDPAIPHDVWNKVWKAKVQAGCMRDILLAHAITDVAVETRSAA
jgi:hypothetical protein